MKSNLGIRLKQKRLTLATIATALAVPPVLYAATYFSDLEVGSTSNTLTGGSAAIGWDNEPGTNSLAIGSDNKPLVNSLGVGTDNEPQYHSLSVGYDNETVEASVAAGASNVVARLSGAVGQGNVVNDPAFSYPRCSMAIGSGNDVFGNQAFAAGLENRVHAEHGAAIGYGLENTAADSTVVGSYNVDKAELRFAVGTGSGPDPADRSNAIEVYANGDIIMTKPQGDILMGEFTALP